MHSKSIKIAHNRDKKNPKNLEESRRMNTLPALIDSFEWNKRVITMLEGNDCSRTLLIETSLYFYPQVPIKSDSINYPTSFERAY